MFFCWKFYEEQLCDAFFAYDQALGNEMQKTYIFNGSDVCPTVQKFEKIPEV